MENRDMLLYLAFCWFTNLPAPSVRLHGKCKWVIAQWTKSLIYEQLLNRRRACVLAAVSWMLGSAVNSRSTWENTRTWTLLYLYTKIWRELGNGMVFEQEMDHDFSLGFHISKCDYWLFKVLGTWAKSRWYYPFKLLCAVPVHYLKTRVARGGGRGREVLSEIWLVLCGTLLETLTLFHNKICEFPYPVLGLTQNSIPFFKKR